MLKYHSTEDYSAGIMRKASPLKRGGKAAASGAYPPPAQGNMAMRMLAEEYRDVYLELARTGIEGLCQKLSVAPAPAAFADGPRQAPEEKAAVPGRGAASPELAARRGGLAEEMPLAVRAYDKAVDCVRRFMAYASQGKLYTGAVDEVAAGLVESLERNPDALLSLPRLQQRGHYTYTHCVNVSALLAAFALDAGEKRDTVTAYAVAGLLHDLGKAFLPVSLLCARRRLSDTEQSLVTRHPLLGHSLLRAMPGVRAEVLQAALEHHERYDGSGYPKGLSGKTISHMGHLAAIADNFDALSSRRPYRGALVPHRTLGVMYQMRKKHFHPELMERFVRLVGIYPVGSIVELRDGYKGVVTAGNPEDPLRPVITLVMDSKGFSMPRHECDPARDSMAAVARCLSPERAGFDPAEVLGLSL